MTGKAQPASAAAPAPGAQTPSSTKSWESMFRAMKTVQKEDKVEGAINTSKYALAFFRLLSMTETVENTLPNDGQTTDFEINNVNRLLKTAILGKLKNINSWNMQRKHFRIALADKESTPYQNMKSLLNNAAFLVKLKSYDFVCGSLKQNAKSEQISLGLFAPMDEDSTAFKDMQKK